MFFQPANYSSLYIEQRNKFYIGHHFMLLIFYSPYTLFWHIISLY